jgi:hypothetical protein
MDGRKMCVILNEYLWRISIVQSHRIYHIQWKSDSFLERATFELHSHHSRRPSSPDPEAGDWRTQP